MIRAVAFACAFLLFSLMVQLIIGRQVDDALPVALAGAGGMVIIGLLFAVAFVDKSSQE